MCLGASEIWAAIVAAVLGALGYLAATFWFRPILRYLDAKQKISSDLIFYANVITDKDLNEEMRRRYWARVESDRRNSADLYAHFESLPGWYLWRLKLLGEAPLEAKDELMGLSNTREWKIASERIAKIIRVLRLRIKNPL